MEALAIRLMSMTLLAAAALVVHVALLRKVLWAEAVTRRDRALACVVPFWPPYVAWRRVGLRWLPSLWLVLVVAYLVLWVTR